MITELEQEFFKVFGIEPVPIKSYGYWLIKGSIAENDKGEKVVYPEITDRVLLELVCIANKYFGDIYFGKNVEQLKKTVLINLAKVSDVIWVKQQIQQLFKEEE